MSQQQRGNDYEHTLSSDIYTYTNGELIPLGAGYNTVHGSPIDMLIDDGHAVHVFELKTTSQDAYTLTWDPEEYQEDDIYYMMKFCKEYPRPTYPYIGMRFNNRQLALTKLYMNDYPDMREVLDDAKLMSPIEAKTNEAGVKENNIRFYKPETGEWPGTNLEEKDVQHVLDTINFTL